MKKIVQLAFIACLSGRVSGADWPQPGCNPRHTAFTPDSPAPPYRQIWAADFSPEIVYAAQPVVAAGRLFHSTLQGSIYALDAATGARLWHFKAGETMWKGPVAGDAENGGEGAIFAAPWDGVLYALNAADGAELWRYDIEQRISGAPCVAEDTVFVGTRDGTMFAVGTDGRLKWKTQLSWHIYSTAAYNNGRVYVFTEDMHVNCLDAKTGGVLWTSEKLYGLLMREFYPVIHDGKVLVRTTSALWLDEMPVQPFGWNPSPDLVKKHFEILDREDARFPRMKPLFEPGRLPPDLLEPQAEILRFYNENPHYRTFFVLDEETGGECFVPVDIHLSGGLQNTAMAPAVCHDGTLVTSVMFSSTRLARLDLKTNRWCDIITEIAANNSDESVYASCGGTRIFQKSWTCGRPDCVFDLATREVNILPGPKSGHGVKLSELANVVRVSVMDAPSGGDGPLTSNRLGGYLGGTSAPVISGSRFYWMHGSHVLGAYEGASAGE